MEALTYSKLHDPPPHSLQRINQTVLHACLCWHKEERNADVCATLAGILADLALPSNRGHASCDRPWLTDGSPALAILEDCSVLSQAPHRFGVLLGVVAAFGTFTFPLLFWGRILCIRL